MRTKNINVRVEPEIARALTWLINKHNYECNDTLTKTGAIERLIKKALESPELLKEDN